MCIKGENLETCGRAMTFVGIMAGGILIVTGIGILAFGSQGWHSLAIGVIVTGGVCFVPALVGKIIVDRMEHLQYKNKQSIQKVSQETFFNEE